MENPPLWYCWHHVTVGKFIHVTLTWESCDAHVTWTCHLYRDTRYFWRHNFPFGRGKMATADFRGHKRTILWNILMRLSRYRSDIMHTESWGECFSVSNLSYLKVFAFQFRLFRQWYWWKHWHQYQRIQHHLWWLQFQMLSFWKNRLQFNVDRTSVENVQPKLEKND